MANMKKILLQNKWIVLLFILLILLVFYYYQTMNNSKIDIVYTWVDSNDPKWLKTKQKYKNNKNTNNDGVTNNRFRELNELKYSLRSVETYAPWVNNIYIVVADGQRPKWLNLNHPKIHLVNHSEIFPDKSHLPTFNSQAIECHLHNIPGLAEHFIYFNDDMFFGNNVTPHEFISGDNKLYYHKTWWSCDWPGEPTIDEEAYHSAWKNNNKILRKSFPDKELSCPWHQAQICKKSEFDYLKRKYPKQFEATSKSKFRGVDNIAPVGLASVYFFDKGDSIYRDEYQLYMSLSKVDESSMFDKISKTRPKFFCINDVEASDENIHKFKNFMMTYFPNKSQFEK